MESIKLEDADGRLSEIIDQAQAGFAVTITRDGKPVAILKRIEPEPAGRTPIDFEALRALRASMTYHGTSAAELIREMRDSRY